eukprot:jgi/Ulvmu1/12321/UM089_0005.1
MRQPKALHMHTAGHRAAKISSSTGGSPRLQAVHARIYRHMPQAGAIASRSHMQAHTLMGTTATTSQDASGHARPQQETSAGRHNTCMVMVIVCFVPCFIPSALLGP